jgi:hypothetical protein
MHIRRLDAKIEKCVIIIEVINGIHADFELCFVHWSGVLELTGPIIDDVILSAHLSRVLR